MNSASTARAVVSVTGPDRKGVVAGFTGCLTGLGSNILEVDQKVVEGVFMMDMLVDNIDCADQGIGGGFDEALAAVGQSMGMSAVVRRASDPRPRVAILATREPHCLNQLTEDAAHDRFRGDFVCVLANHETLEQRAAAAGLPFECKSIVKDGGPEHDKAAHFAWIRDRLAHYNVDLVVLARYMQIVPPELVAIYPSKIINIHPSLLPAFPGARPYHAAWDKGVRFAGCTCHYVTDELDQGPIITQGHFDIDVGHDTAADVRQRGQQLESRLLSDAVAHHLDHRLIVVGRRVVIRPGLSRFLDHAE